jgi:hypothetical protein
VNAEAIETIDRERQKSRDANRGRCSGAGRFTRHRARRGGTDEGPLVGSFALARLLTEPIGKLSTSLAATAASRNVSTPVPLAGSSHEVDAFTETFNALMKSVALAEAQTEEATPARFAPSRPRSTRAIRTRPATQSASACCRWQAVA